MVLRSLLNGATRLPERNDTDSSNQEQNFDFLPSAGAEYAYGYITSQQFANREPNCFGSSQSSSCKAVGDLTHSVM